MEIGIEQQLNLIDTETIETVLGQANLVQRVSFTDLVYQAISGELNLSLGGILSGGMRLIFAEVVANIALMQGLIFIGVLAALLKILTESFESKAVGELGFYICYILLVTVVFYSFRVAYVTASGMIHTVTNFVQVSIPVVISLVLMSGNITAAYVYNSLFLFAINIFNTIIISIVFPLVIAITTIQIVNFLTENKILGELSESVKKGVSLSIKGLAFGFIGILTLQRISAPIINNLAIRTARITMNVVPVVGEVLSGALDSVLYFASATKSGVIVAIVLAIIYICIVPVINLTALIFVYKFVAAIIQPISDSRIVKCLDTVGSFTALLLGVCVMVALMFSMALILLVTF